jgi:formate/nitrite transporter FocA (FNT family)
MASSRTPLLADPNRHFMEPNYDEEETALLGGFATTSPTRPFATSFCPTLFLRGLALIVAIPAFIIFIVEGPSYSPSIVFLSFAIARQLVVLGSHFGSQIMVVHIEIVHPKWKSVSAKAQEKWIKKTVAGAFDAGILLGLLVSLAIVAHKVDTANRVPQSVTAAVILGFIVL